MRGKVNFIVLVAIASITSTAVFAGDIKVNIENIRNDRGRMQIAVFNSEASFDQQNADSAFAAISIAARKGSQSITLHDVPSGSYAIAIHHDENANGEFDVSARKFPEEGFAYSNNVGADKEVTPFSDAVFDVSDTGGTHNIEMIYIK
ncbi:MAG: DUF2141 domain-containing protein [Alphaproteobacteria bacterium]